MGSIIGRSRKDGSKAFIAQIVQRKPAPSRIPRRKLSTANAWMVNREAEKADICRAKRHVRFTPESGFSAIAGVVQIGMSALPPKATSNAT